VVATDPLIRPEDVATRLAVTWDDEAALGQIEALCDDVSALIRARKPHVDEWIASGRMQRQLVEAIAAQILVRAWFSVSTGGIPIVGESHPEYSVQFSQAAKAGLMITDDELRGLTPASELGAGGRAFSIKPG
jgi:hypothetical protein